MATIWNSRKTRVNFPLSILTSYLTHFFLQLPVSEIFKSFKKQNTLYTYFGTGINRKKPESNHFLNRHRSGTEIWNFALDLNRNRTVISYTLPLVCTSSSSQLPPHSHPHCLQPKAAPSGWGVWSSSWWHGGSYPWGRRIAHWEEPIWGFPHWWPHIRRGDECSIVAPAPRMTDQIFLALANRHGLSEFEWVGGAHLI